MIKVHEFIVNVRGSTATVLCIANLVKEYKTLNVIVSAKTVFNGTFSITRKTDLKYSSCCGSVVLDFSHARFTV